MGSLASDSDMAVAGMFFAFVILIYFAISDYNRLIRYFMLAVELFIAGRILGVIYIFNQFNTRIIKKCWQYYCLQECICSVFQLSVS